MFDVNHDSLILLNIFLKIKGLLKIKSKTYQLYCCFLSAFYHLANNNTKCSPLLKKMESGDTKMIN